MKILLTFLTEKKKLFWTNKNFHQQIIVISSQNNVQKFPTQGHEQAYAQLS